MVEDPTWQSYEDTAVEYARNVEDLHPHKEGARFLSLLPGKSIIDIGCGSGRDAKIFSDKGYRVVGIDYSPKMIEIARHKAPDATFIVADIQKMPLTMTFDGAWANVSLLHIPKASFLRTLQQIYVLLNPNGIFYMKVKEGSGEFFEPDLRYAARPEKFFSYFHLSELSPLLTQAGFTPFDIYSERKNDAYHTHPYIHTFSKKTPHFP